MVNQIQKNSNDINARLQAIQTSCLFKPPETKYLELPSAKDFFENIERERSKDYEVLARKYRAIGPLLTKVEGLVVNTNTGKSEKLHPYYAYWERKIYTAITKVRLKCTCT